MKSLLALACLMLGLSFANAQASPPQPSIDLTNAVIVSYAKPHTVEAKAVQMLVEEVEKRTRIRWAVTDSVPGPSRPIIVVGSADTLHIEMKKGIGSEWNAPEGYFVSGGGGHAPKLITVLGADARGVLFGVGRLLRELRMERDRISIPANLNIASKPYHKLRGHQLGYRPKTNSYDAWTVPMWEQYIRDLIVFGANSVELLPPRTDDDADSPHFPLPPMKMMVEMDKLLDSYGMDVWIWYPAMEKDYTDPKTVAASLKEWGDVFRRLKRVDAVFVPGGDPGHTEPKVLMALLEKQAANLRKYHPKAQMWVSPQGFTQVWMDQFIGILKNQRPKWLNGVVFGPQVRTPLPEMRKLVPAQYPIRHYPDITHSMQCQFPVENWDVAFALTEGREPINPRPVAEAHICRWHQPYTIGSITYSEGCNDDVNKAIWSALEWDPKADVKEILREYSRYFISPRFEEKFAEGLLELEQDWRMAFDDKDATEETFRHFVKMEEDATPQEKLNWRFQQALYRAWYDGFVAAQSFEYRNLERELSTELAKAHTPSKSKEFVSYLLSRNDLLPGNLETPPSLYSQRKARVFEIAVALYQSIRMQLSVGRYGAIAVWRGANLDSINTPLTNFRWISLQLQRIRDLNNDEERLRQLRELENRNDPGPGGIYIAFGTPQSSKYIVDGPGFKDDPGFMKSVRIGFEEDTKGPIEWARFAETLYDTPLRMRFPGLDSNAAYRMRIVYGPDKPEIKLRCVANEKYEVHGWINKPKVQGPMEFDIPKEATASGTLNLMWTREPGLGGNGRGCQVCEIWLMRK